MPRRGHRTHVLGRKTVARTRLVRLPLPVEHILQTSLEQSGLI